MIGEPVERVHDLEELADRPAGVEVVVHGVQEPLAVLGDLLEQGRIARIELAAASRGRELVESLAGQLGEPLERPVKRLQAAIDLVEAAAARSRSAGDNGSKAAVPAACPACGL